MEKPTRCCGCDKGRRKLYPSEYYLSPWGEKTETDYYCQDCLDQGYDRDGDFSPEYCEHCERDIIQRNPHNGWRGYFMTSPDRDSLWCVACVQEHYMAKGISLEQVEEQRYQCDFWNHNELRERGFVEHGMYKTPEELDVPLRYAIEHNYIALLDQGPTGIGSGADYVTLWLKARGKCSCDNGYIPLGGALVKECPVCEGRGSKGSNGGVE